MEPLIAGTRQLIDLALHSPHKTPPHFLFTSSLQVFSSTSFTAVSFVILPQPGSHLDWTVGVDAPETCNSRPFTAIGNGYTESKWVAESILARAAKQTPLCPSIVRLGQICGGRNGSWNPQQWFPAMIRSAQMLSCLPQPTGASNFPTVVFVNLKKLSWAREISISRGFPFTSSQPQLWR